METTEIKNRELAKILSKTKVKYNSKNFYFNILN